MIDVTHALSISRQAQLAGISRGSVYYMPKPVGAADLVLMRRLDALHLEHPFSIKKMHQESLFGLWGDSAGLSCQPGRGLMGGSFGGLTGEEVSGQHCQDGSPAF